MVGIGLFFGLRFFRFLFRFILFWLFALFVFFFLPSLLPASSFPSAGEDSSESTLGGKVAEDPDAIDPVDGPWQWV